MFYCFGSYLNHSIPCSTSKENLLLLCSTCITSSMTRWLDYFSIFCLLQQWLITQKHKIVPKMVWKFAKYLINLPKIAQTLLTFWHLTKFCQMWSHWRVPCDHFLTFSLNNLMSNLLKKCYAILIQMPMPSVWPDLVEISPSEQHFKSLGQLFESLLIIWKCWTLFGHFHCFWAHFHCDKWGKIEKII